MKIAVVALGKIGLPLAAHFASKGHEVVGVDTNPAVVEMVNAARAPFPGESGLDEVLREVVPRGLLTATTDYTQAIPGAETVVIVVPLFVDDQARPDFGWMDAATASVGENLSSGTLVAYETTLPIGTTRSRWKPMLEQLSGLSEGRDFHLAFSPERVLTGRVFADLRRYPKLIGGLSEAGAERATEFYQAVIDFDNRSDLARPNGVWDLGSAEAAEFAKLAETTYRDVNIGLANQFALFAENNDIDVYQVIEASNSQPYSHIHRPGIAVGGHCIPVYPRLYLWNDPQATIVSTARAANATMPEHAVNLLASIYGDLCAARVVVLGAAYRGGVKETAFSGVFPTVAALQQRGAHVAVHDPLYSDDELIALGLTPYHFAQVADAVIIHTDHTEYRAIGVAEVPGVKAVIDGRNISSAGAWRGATFRVIGRAVGTEASDRVALATTKEVSL